jgi:hypothetical protein
VENQTGALLKIMVENPETQKSSGTYLSPGFRFAIPIEVVNIARIRLCPKSTTSIKYEYSLPELLDCSKLLKEGEMKSNIVDCVECENKQNPSWSVFAKIISRLVIEVHSFLNLSSIHHKS